jgi:hypothetical protein
MHIDGTIINPVLQVTWMVLFLGYVAWFLHRHRDREAPAPERMPLVRFGGPWTLFSKRFWREADIPLRKGSHGAFVLGVLPFGILYFLFDLVS